MKSKISLFNKSIIKSDLVRFCWVSVAYAVCLFLFLPLRFMMQILPMEENWQKDAILDSLQRLSSFGSPYSSYNGLNFQVIFACTVPVILAVLLFDYLHSPRAATAILSLPLRRRTLFLSHTASGFLLISLPVLLTGVILEALSLFTGLGEYCDVRFVLQWVGLTLLYDILFFSFAVFVGMFTGNSIAHIAFTYILNVLPYGLYIMVAYNMEALFYGFTAEGVRDGWARALPLLRIAGYSDKGFTVSEGTIYCLIAFAFLAAAGIIHQYRKAEAAGNIVAFRVTQYIFKYGFALSLMLLGGFLAGYFYHCSSAAVVFVCIVSAAAGYWISQMLLERTVRVWHAYKGFLVFCAVVALTMAGISADFTGFVKQVPMLDQIENAYYGENFLGWRVENDRGSQGLYFNSEGRFEEKENIKAVMSLHRMLIENRSKYGKDRYVAYSLKNGKTVLRRYKVDEHVVKRFVRPLYESEEFKTDKFPVLSQKVQNIKMVELFDRRLSNKPLILADAGKLRSLVETMQREFAEAGYEEISRYDHYVTIKLTDENGRGYEYGIDKDYQLIYSWLKDNGYYRSVVLQPEELERATVTLNHAVRDSSGGYAATQAMKELEVGEGSLLIEIADLCTPEYPFDFIENYYSIDFFVNEGDRTTEFRGYLYPNAQISKELGQKLRELDSNGG